MVKIPSFIDSVHSILLNLNCQYYVNLHWSPNNLKLTSDTYLSWYSIFPPALVIVPTTFPLTRTWLFEEALMILSTSPTVLSGNGTT